MLPPHEFDVRPGPVRGRLEGKPGVERDDASSDQRSVGRANLDHIAPPERAVRPPDVPGPQRLAAPKTFRTTLRQDQRPPRV